MDWRSLGRILGCLASARDAAKGNDFVQNRILEAISHIEFPAGQVESDALKEVYREFVEGWLEVRAPLQLIVLVAAKLPREPQLTFGLPRQGELYFHRKRSSMPPIIGVNETGKLLVQVMVEAVKQRSRRQPRDTE